jgi:hypothetical protein
MEKSLLDFLISIDDAENCEASKNFNYLKEMDNVKNIKNKLESLVKEHLEIDEFVQDASFFTELFILETSQKMRKDNGEGYVCLFDLSIRFSSFGNMVCIFSNNDFDIYSKYPIKEIIDLLKSEGYVYVDAKQLDELYTGINTHIGDKDTWWIRYFDYL